MRRLICEIIQFNEKLAQRVKRLGLHVTRAAREHERKQKILAVAQRQRLVKGVLRAQKNLRGRNHARREINAVCFKRKRRARFAVKAFDENFF